MILQVELEGLPPDKAQSLRKWLSQPEARSFREHVAALAAKSAIEAATHLSLDDGSGVEMEEAKTASKAQNKFEDMLRLMTEMKDDDYQFYRVRITMNQELL